MCEQCDDDSVEILTAEHFGDAAVVDGFVDIGGVKVPWEPNVDTDTIYVRRSSEDLSIVEIILARHDLIEDEILMEKEEMAEIYPLGPKEYWRSILTGKEYEMAQEEFEEYWENQDDYS